MVLEDPVGDMHFMKKQEIKWFENKTISASEFPAFQSYFLNMTDRIRAKP